MSCLVSTTSQPEGQEPAGGLQVPSSPKRLLYGEASMKTRVNRLTATTKHSVILDAHPQEACLSSTIFITGLQASTVYDFRVAAGNAKGLGPWSEPSIKIKTKIALPPPAPPRPTVGQVGPYRQANGWQCQRQP